MDIAKLPEIKMINFQIQKYVYGGVSFSFINIHTLILCYSLPVGGPLPSHDRSTL